MANLQDLGLSDYEARAYRSLLDTGPTTAKELSRASEVPMGRIYDVLNSLETHNLVRTQAASRPKKYVAVEPETALDRLLADKKQELDERAQQYERIVEQLSDQLETTDPVEESFWTAAVGPEETLDLLVERLSAADDRIVVVGTLPSRQFDVEAATGRVVDELVAALERGVDVSIMLRPELLERIPEATGREYYDRLEDYERFQQRVSGEITTTFELIDGVEVCIEVPHPLNQREAFGVIDLKDPEFVADIEATFDNRWSDATEIEPP